jgi:cell division protein FtsI/penicillin-binding protein 2
MTEDSLAERHYPYPELSTVTGYYSLRYGVGGTEAAFDPILRGTAGQTEQARWLADLLHRPAVGQDIELTIDLSAQAAADVALGDREGAVVVMDLETGAILVMSSHPTFDPNQLDEMWDMLRQDESAPLLNRATQGLFPVGELARLIGLIGIYNAGTTVPDDPLTAPLEDVLAPLGEAGYLATAHQLGLIRPLNGFPSLPGRLPDFDGDETIRELAVTPLHLARVVAALELEGYLPAPILSLASEGDQTPVISPDTARNIRSLLPQVDAQIIGLTGLASPEETGQAWLSWFVGLAPAEAAPVSEGIPAMLPLDPTQAQAQAPAGPAPTPPVEQARARYVVVSVVVTGEPDGEAALRVSRAPLKVILGQE